MKFAGPKTKEMIDDFLKTRIESLNLSTRTKNTLINSSIRTIGGILRTGGSLMSGVDGVGIKGINEIKQVLSESFEIVVSNGEKKGEYLQFIPKYYESDDFVPKETSKDWFEKKHQVLFVCPRTKDEMYDYLKTRIESLGFSQRTKNALFFSSIRTIGGILRNRSALYEVKGLGVKGIREIINELSRVFDVEVNETEFKFSPKSLELMNSPLEQTEEDRVRERDKETEVQIIEEKYFEKQDEREYLYQIKIVSLGFNSKIETLLLRNDILTVGVLLRENLEDIIEKNSLSFDEAGEAMDIFEYFILKDKQIEDELEDLRRKEFELIGCLNHKLKKTDLYNIGEIIIPSRNLSIFNSFREGLTLEKIGKENKITRERVRQVIKATLDKMGLDYEEEQIKIYSKRSDLKSKKLPKPKKIKTWSRYYDACKSCGTTSTPHSHYGLCNICGNRSISGVDREKMILEHDNKCDLCNLSRDHTVRDYGRDFYLSRKNNKILCKKCFLETTGKLLSVYRKDKWKMFYK